MIHGGPHKFEKLPRNSDDCSEDPDPRDDYEQTSAGRHPNIFRLGLSLVLTTSLVAVVAVNWKNMGFGTNAVVEDAITLTSVHKIYKPHKINHRGPWGEVAGPDLNSQDYRLGARPKYGADPAALMGSPPWPHQKKSHGCGDACKGTCCNGGKLCCGPSAVCCGTSCCSGGSICCDAKIGLCCAGGTMCCWGKMCCASSWSCGRTRNFGDGLRFKVLKQCGGGAQFRRLLDKHAYARNFRRLLASNETGLRELLGIKQS